MVIVVATPACRAFRSLAHECKRGSTQFFFSLPRPTTNSVTCCVCLHILLHLLLPIVRPTIHIECVYYYREREGDRTTGINTKRVENERKWTFLWMFHFPLGLFITNTGWGMVGRPPLVALTQSIHSGTGKSPSSGRDNSGHTHTM